MMLRKTPILSPVKLGAAMLIIGCASLSNTVNASWFRRCIGTIQYKCCTPMQSLPQDLQDALSKYIDCLLNGPVRKKSTTLFTDKTSKYLGEQAEVKWQNEVNLICAIIDDPDPVGIVPRISALLQAGTDSEQGITNKALGGVAVLLALSLMEVVDYLDLAIDEDFAMTNWETRKMEWSETIVGKAVLASLKILKSAAQSVEPNEGQLAETILKETLRAAAKKFYTELEAHGPGEIVNDRPVIAFRDCMQQSIHNLGSSMQRGREAIFDRPNCTLHLWENIVALCQFGTDAKLEEEVGSDGESKEEDGWATCLMEFLKLAGGCFRNINGVKVICDDPGIVKLSKNFAKQIHEIGLVAAPYLRRAIPRVTRPSTIAEAKEAFKLLADIGTQPLETEPELVPTEEMWTEWQQEWDNEAEEIRNRYRR